MTPQTIQSKIDKIKENYLSYKGIHTREYMFDFLITKPLMDLLESVHSETLKECREIFIEEVDWAEWGRGDEEAGRDFDEAITNKQKEL